MDPGARWVLPPFPSRGAEVFVIQMSGNAADMPLHSPARSCHAHPHAHADPRMGSTPNALMLSCDGDHDVQVVSTWSSGLFPPWRPLAHPETSCTWSPCA